MCAVVDLCVLWWICVCCGGFVCAVVDLCVLWWICVCCGGFVCDVTLVGQRKPLI